MAKFYGSVGFSHQEETGPGVWEEKVTEKQYYGDVQALTTKYTKGESINDNLNLSNQISIVADPFAYYHYAQIKYVKWLDAVWKVNSVEVQRPRLILHISEVYNGPTG